MQPDANGDPPEASRPGERERRDRLTVVGLALLSALFFTGALAYGLGSGLLTGGGDGDQDAAADRNGRKLPRDWATLIPLQPLDSELDRDADDSEVAGAREDPPGSDRAPAASSSPRPVQVRIVPAAVRRSPRVRPAVVLSVPQRTPILRTVVGRRLPDLVDLTPSRPDLPQLPDADGGNLVPDIDVLPGGVRIPPIVPFPGVQIPPIGPFPGVRIPPIDPAPGSALPVPGGLTRPGDGLGALPAPVVVSVPSFEPLEAIESRRKAGALDAPAGAGAAPTTVRSTTATESAGDRGPRGGDAAAKSLPANRRAARPSAERRVRITKSSAGSSRPARGLPPQRQHAESPAPKSAEPQQARASERCPARSRSAEGPEDLEPSCRNEPGPDNSTNAPTDPDGDRQGPPQPKARPDPGEEDDA